MLPGSGEHTFREPRGQCRWIDGGEVANVKHRSGTDALRVCPPSQRATLIGCRARLFDEKTADDLRDLLVIEGIVFLRPRGRRDAHAASFSPQTDDDACGHLTSTGADDIKDRPQRVSPKKTCRSFEFPAFNRQRQVGRDPFNRLSCRAAIRPLNPGQRRLPCWSSRQRFSHRRSPPFSRHRPHLHRHPSVRCRERR